LPEHLEVLGDGGPAQLELAGEVVDGARAIPEGFEQPAPDWGGECAEDVGGHGHDDASEIPDA
jgi:hypothetical protein